MQQTFTILETVLISFVNKLYKYDIHSKSMSENIQPVFPASSANLKLKVAGVYAFPDEWRTTDQANPGMFTYVVKFANGQIGNGKICARELTEKQMREEQSKKKGGKKDGKKQENPAQAEALRQLLEKEEEEQRRKLEEWSKLSEEQQFFHASQDRFKSPILKLDPAELSISFSGKSFVAFEEHVIKDGGQWIYFFKTPTANEEEMAKLKKAKPKTLANANDLNPVVMRAWVDLSSLRSDTEKEATLRCNIVQVDASDQTPKPNLGKAYIKVNLVFDEPIIKKLDEYKSQTLIKDPPKPASLPAQIKSVQDLREQIKIALQSLAMEYSAMFQKQLNLMEEQKTNQIFFNNRKNEPGRRKQQFLYDFNISGKYRVLKQRLKKGIVSLCESKFSQKMNGTKSFTGVTCSMRDQFYSEIYDFLVNQYSETMSELIEEKRQILYEVYVLKKEHQEKLSEEHLQAFIQQTREQRLQRIISQHLEVGNASYGATLYQKQIKKYPNDVSLKYQYSLYCIRNGLKSVKEVVAEGYIDEYIQIHKQDEPTRLTYVLLMIASENQKNLNKAWVVLREIIQKDQKNIELLLVAAVLFEMNKNEDCSSIFLTRASREQLRKLDKIKEEGKHKEEPQASEIPSLSSSATYAQELSNEQKDKLWGIVISKFADIGLMNIVQKLKSKLTDQNSTETKIQNLKILMFRQSYQECREEATNLFKETNDVSVFEILVSCLSKLKNFEEGEKYLKYGLKIVPEQKKINILLKLGHIYLNCDKFGNAKACLVKYLEKVKPSGGLSWQILGKSELETGKFDAAIKCLRYSNLSDPYNSDTWALMANAYAGIGNLVMVNQCLNIYSRDGEKQKIQQIDRVVEQVEPDNFYAASLKEKIKSNIKEVEI